jgi:hypothetical protein
MDNVIYLNKLLKFKAKKEEHDFEAEAWFLFLQKFSDLNKHTEKGDQDVLFREGLRPL